MIAFSLWMGTWYAAVSLLLTVAMGIMLLDNRFSKKRDRLLAPAIKLIHSLESDDETRSCFEEGKAYYLAMERRSIIDTILGLLFIWASVLWAYERLLRSDGGSRCSKAHNTRSEEYMSELKSLAYIVCRILLEETQTNKRLM